MTAVPTVFVVDDNPGVRKSLQSLVEAEGLAVATYASAAEFLAAWDAQRPGCLVLDVRRRGRDCGPLLVPGHVDVPADVGE